MGFKVGDKVVPVPVDPSWYLMDCDKDGRGACYVHRMDQFVGKTGTVISSRHNDGDFVNVQFRNNNWYYRASWLKPFLAKPKFNVGDTVCPKDRVGNQRKEFPHYVDDMLHLAGKQGTVNSILERTTLCDRIRYNVQFNDETKMESWSYLEEWLDFSPAKAEDKSKKEPNKKEPKVYHFDDLKIGQKFRIKYQIPGGPIFMKMISFSCRTDAAIVITNKKGYLPAGHKCSISSSFELVLAH